MTDHHIRALSENEQQRVVKAIENAEKLGYLNLETLDQAAREGELDALAGGLGLILQDKTGMQWAALTDGANSTIVLTGAVGHQHVMLYPFDVVERRRSHASATPLSDYVTDVLQQIEEVK